MIFLLAGTKDGRELGEEIIKKSYKLIISVTSDYGKNLIRQNENLIINDKPLDLNELKKYLTENKIKIIIDASHPYAVNVSQNAIAASKKLNIPYIRYERKKTTIDYENMYYAKDNNDAASIAANFDENIFFTTGSKTAKFFFENNLLKNKRLVFRVLPSAKVLSELESLGISPENIIALKGPFTEELNIALFKAYNADAIVTKDSGNIGGVDTKISAAKKLNLPIIMIERPKINYPNIAYNFDKIFEFIDKQLR